MTPILYAALIACATIIAWLYLIAIDAERDRDRWRKYSREWESRANKAQGFAEDAIAALAQARNAIDERDAELKRLRAVRREYVAALLDGSIVDQSWQKWTN